MEKGSVTNNFAELVTNGSDVFNKKLFPILSKGGTNLIYSPLSAHSILSLAYQGATGQTAQSLQNALGLTDAAAVAEGYQFWMEKLNSLQCEKVKIANKIFVNQHYELNDQFNSTAKKYFLSEAENVDFSNSKKAAKKINKWVEKKTKNLIHDVAESGEFDDSTCLFMVNAIYFKGEWDEEFCETEESKFYTTETDTVDCTMMLGIENFQYGEDDDLDAQILRIPYRSNRMSMLVILPKSRTGIQLLCEKLKTKSLCKLSNSLCIAEVSISLPKCRLESTVDLNVPLSDIGLDVIFSNAAQFPNMLKEEAAIKVSKVIQKAFIDINEKGTEAAVATGVKMVACCGFIGLRKVSFHADHPFVFCLCYHEDGMGLPIFVGVLNRPNGN